MSTVAKQPKTGRIIPNTPWQTVKVGDALDLINGRAFKPTEWTKTGIPIVRIQNLNNPNAPFNCYKGDLPAKIALDDGDLLFAWSGTPGTSFGAHIWTGGKAWLNQHIFKVGFHAAQFNKRFLQLAINQNLNEYIRAAHGGAGLAHITKGKFEASELPCPPLTAQRRIVAEIEKQFTRLDAGVAALRRTQANLKRYRAAVLKAACEGRLVPTEVELAKQQSSKRGSIPRKNGTPDFESGAMLLDRILNERRKNWSSRGEYREPAEPDAANFLSKLPEGWACASVDQVTQNFDGRRIPLKSADRDKRSGQYPYYGASGIIDDIDDFLFDGEFLLVAEDGANLLSRNTPIAFNATGRFWVNNHAHIIQTRGGIPLGYLAVFLNGKDISFSVTGSAQPKLTQAALNKIPIPLPPLAEQTRIVAEVERRFSVADELETVVNANLLRATRLRQSVLQQAFSRKLFAARLNAAIE